MSGSLQLLCVWGAQDELAGTTEVSLFVAAPHTHAHMPTHDPTRAGSISMLHLQTRALPAGQGVHQGYKELLAPSRVARSAGG